MGILVVVVVVLLVCIFRVKRRAPFPKWFRTGKALSFTTATAAPSVLSVLTCPFSLGPVGLPGLGRCDLVLQPCTFALSHYQ